MPEVVKIKNFTALWFEPVVSYLEGLFIILALFSYPRTELQQTVPQVGAFFGSGGKKRSDEHNCVLKR